MNRKKYILPTLKVMAIGQQQPMMQGSTVNVQSTDVSYGGDSEEEARARTSVWDE